MKLNLIQLMKKKIEVFENLSYVFLKIKKMNILGF